MVSFSIYMRSVKVEYVVQVSSVTSLYIGHRIVFGNMSLADRQTDMIAFTKTEIKRNKLRIFNPFGKSMELTTCFRRTNRNRAPINDTNQSIKTHQTFARLQYRQLPGNVLMVRPRNRSACLFRKCGNFCSVIGCIILPNNCLPLPGSRFCNLGARIFRGLLTRKLRMTNKNSIYLHEDIAI